MSSRDISNMKCITKGHTWNLFKFDNHIAKSKIGKRWWVVYEHSIESIIKINYFGSHLEL